MKLLLCHECGDIVRLFPEKRFCKCGRSWGYYADDHATTIQTSNSLSLGFANQDVDGALDCLFKDPQHFSPLLMFRAWINPLSEPDTKYVKVEEAEPDTGNDK